MHAQLANLADVEDRIGRVLDEDEEVARVNALLDDASAAIRLETNRLFGEGTATVRVKPRGGVLRLRSGITAITEVRTITAPTTTLAFSWDGLALVAIGTPNVFDMDYATSVVDLDFTYDEGPVPDIIKGICANMVARAFGVRADTTGLQQESIAGYSYTIGAAAAAGGIGMLPDERRALQRFKRMHGPIWMSTRRSDAWV